MLKLMDLCGLSFMSSLLDNVEQQNEFEGELRNKVKIVWLIYNSFYTLR
jgi:hypothetical protein